MALALGSAISGGQKRAAPKQALISGNNSSAITELEHFNFRSPDWRLSPVRHKHGKRL